MKKGYSSHIGLFFLKLASKIPFTGIYFLADFFYFLVYYIIGYRKKVVQENLRHSFPEKTEHEIKKISTCFYRHFSDLTLEIIKMPGINEKTFRKRMAVKNPELVNRFFEQGKSVVVLTMHYNNWEWASIFPLFIQHQVLGVYKPLHNLDFDAYLNQVRRRFGAIMIPNSLVLRKIFHYHQKQEPVFIWLAGDQTPPHFHKFWMMFMNQETMFYPGPAAISRRFNYPVIFQKTLKIKRGFYETTFEVLVDNPKDLSEEYIMNVYIQKMEETIREHPEYYLWSHKRWKNKRPEGVSLKQG
ncbi:MAG: lysophospholipid acyltransferase family protein [Mariniphaga sp.]|nr:lysophospholipid acyltransferase family protein [Mariniphaga sp.]